MHCLRNLPFLGVVALLDCTRERREKKENELTRELPSAKKKKYSYRRNSRHHHRCNCAVLLLHDGIGAARTVQARHCLQPPPSVQDERWVGLVHGAVDLLLAISPA